MGVEDLSEKEQLDQMRSWWSEYGNYVIGGIVIGIALIVGFNQWGSRVKTQQVEASELYESLREAVAADKTDDADESASELFSKYENTAYPAKARLVMARVYMDKGRDQDAADALRAVVDADPDSELGLLARSRLAKVLLYQEKPQEVVDLLSPVDGQAFTSRFSETLGDAYAELGEFAKAKEAFSRAMEDSASSPTVDRSLLQMKINDLPEIALAVASPEGDGTADDATVAASEVVESAVSENDEETESGAEKVE